MRPTRKIDDWSLYEDGDGIHRLIGVWQGQTHVSDPVTMIDRELGMAQTEQFNYTLGELSDVPANRLKEQYHQQQRGRFRS